MNHSRRLIQRVRHCSALFLLTVLLLSASVAAADNPGQMSSAVDTHYGIFGLLDHRSRYGQFWFPEPFRIDEMDVDNEVRFDWVHQEGRGRITDEASLELEKAFGLTTFELEIPYERETEGNERSQGAGNIEVSVRRPIFQSVSANGYFDNTVGVGLELGVPSNSEISKNTEGVVKMFDALRLGEHLSLQALAGYAYLMGPGAEGGTQTFEYGLVAGYSLSHEVLALPHVEQLVPILELKGETALNKEDAGQNNLSGTLGIRANLDAIGALQPRIGIGYVFPVDQGARDEFKWGLMTSLVFEY